MTTLGPYLLGYNETPECGIYTGDARELAPAIPDESVDLIFTDPTYDRVDDYRWLTKTAARVLKKSGNILVWSNGRWQYRNTQWLDTPSLFYHRTLAVVMSNRKPPMDGKIIAKVNYVIWFGRNDSRGMLDYLRDGHISVGKNWNGIPKPQRKWGKSAEFTKMCLKCFATRKSIIVDFFAGNGTVSAVCKSLGYQYLAFEIDPEIAEEARERVQQTQPPLLMPQPKQTEMML